MATISSAGVGSGLDVNSIVSQLMAIEKKPLTVLEAKETSIQSTVSEYGKIKSALSTLRDLASKLSGTTTWGQTVTNSSSTAVSASSNNSAAGTYTVEVQSLASVQTLATGAPVPATSTLGAGTLRIELGTWGTGQTSFTPKVGAAAVDIDITAADTLETIRDKVNGAGAGVTAMIMTDAAGSRLLIRSNASGAENAFRTSGHAALAFDPSSGVSTLTQSQTAADAMATVNGLAVKSTSNTFSNIVDGLTLNLSAVTTAPVTVNVVTDAESLKKTLTEFAAAYTAVVKLIAADTKYDPAAKKGAILQGDSAAIGLLRQLRTLAGAGSGASAVYGRLSDVGLELQSDGSMTVNASKLGSALGNLAELKKLFANSDLLDASNDGLGKRFRVMTDGMLGIDGALTTRTEGLGQQLQRNQKDQDRLELRLEAIEKRLRAQYTALDATMALLNSKSSYITQQIAAFNASNSSK